MITVIILACIVIVLGEVLLAASPAAPKGWDCVETSCRGGYPLMEIRAWSRIGICTRGFASQQKKSYRVLVEYANGTQAEVYFDHVPQIDCVVRVPGSDAYARVITVWPNGK